MLGNSNFLSVKLGSGAESSQSFVDTAFSAYSHLQTNYNASSKFYPEDGEILSSDIVEWPLVSYVIRGQRAKLYSDND
jgi:hypothetical protein